MNAHTMMHLFSLLFTMTEDNTMQLKIPKIRMMQTECEDMLGAD